MNIKAFHTLSYGLYIIASEFERKKTGYVANTVFQVTSSPAQLAISCNKQNFSLDIILKSGKFSISVLKKELDTKIIGDFGFMSSAEINKFEKANIITSNTGVPIVIEESIAWFDCKIINTVDVGTHVIIIGEVLNCDIIGEDEPLTYEYYREKYKMFSPKNAPTYIDPEKLKEEEVKEKVSHTTDITRHTCVICGYTYDPEEGDASIGITPGTSFEDLPEDYKCPICSASKEYFKEV